MQTIVNKFRACAVLRKGKVINPLVQVRVCMPPCGSKGNITPGCTKIVIAFGSLSIHLWAFVYEHICSPRTKIFLVLFTELIDRRQCVRQSVRKIVAMTGG